MAEPPKKAFYAQGGVVPPELTKFSDLIKTSGSLRPDSPTVNLKQMIEPYYGEGYQEQVDQAKTYFDQTFPIVDGKRVDKMKNYSLNNTEPTAGLETNVRVTDRSQVDSGLMMGGHQRESGEKPATRALYFEDTAGNKAIQMPSQRTAESVPDYDKFGQAQITTPDNGLPATLEHEVGHAAYRGLGQKIPVSNANTRYAAPGEKAGSPKRHQLEEDWSQWGSHLGKANEFSNGLGKLQRETYQITGKRLDGKGLDKLIDSIGKGPDAFKLPQYSPDVHRVLDVLNRARKGGKLGLAPQNEGLYKDARLLIPSFVQNGNPTARQIFS